MKRILLLALVASVLVAIPTAASAMADKVDVCHLNVLGEWQVNSVKEGRAVQAHLDHGDALPGEAVPNMAGYSFDDACVPVADEVVFAVAYVDVVDDGGSYDAAVDVLISKLVDDNGNGVPDAGDAIITDRYPTNLAGTAFGEFGVKQTAVTAFFTAGGTGNGFCQAVGQNSSGLYEWSQAFDQESYQEGIDFYLTDSYDTDADVIDVVNIGTLSQPATDVFLLGVSPGDDPFLDIDLNCLS